MVWVGVCVCGCVWDVCVSECVNAIEPRYCANMGLIVAMNAFRGT